MRVKGRDQFEWGKCTTEIILEQTFVHLFLNIFFHEKYSTSNRHNNIIYIFEYE